MIPSNVPDVHVSLDDVVVMFHDPSLERTTDSNGLIRNKKWYGPDGMEQVRTTKEPKQAIPTFAETVSLLMKPENKHVKFNVDCKVYNDPPRLFSLMHKIVSAHENWETVLAPRIILGLWHPRFIKHAKEHMPYCTRSYIGGSPYIARKYFWEHCGAFSMWFAGLATVDGQRFIRECKAGNKHLMVWTVNERAQMMECARWRVNAVLTDRTKMWLALREELQTDFEKVASQHARAFLWTTPKFYTAVQFILNRLDKAELEREGGSFDAAEVESTPVVRALA